MALALDWRMATINLKHLRKRFRPALGTIAAVMILIILALPLGSLIFLRLYENLLIHQTEGELISQSAVLAAAMAEDGSGLLKGRQLSTIVTHQQQDLEGRYNPIQPSLDLAFDTIYGRRPDPRLGRKLTEREREVGRKMLSLIEETQRITLAGFRVLAADGIVIAGREEVGQSLAHIPEVALALEGTFTSVMRDRFSEQPAPPLSSLSRGTKVRLFVTMPVLSEGHIVGVIYASRTPMNVLKDLYSQSERVFWAALVIVAGAALVGFIFVRTVSRPIHQLKDRAELVAKDPRAALAPLKHYGSQEVKSLADSFSRMAGALSERSEYLRTFAAHVSHELKSPLTSIVGASEVLQSDLSPEERKRFLQTIQAEAERMSRLLERLRDLAKAEIPNAKGDCDLGDVVSRLQETHPIEIEWRSEEHVSLPMTDEDAFAVLNHLVENSSRHGASEVSIALAQFEGGFRLSVSDNGAGIPPENREIIFDPFFTTRREEGGTGMGLGIARTLMKAHGGDLTLADSETGACFELTFPSNLSP